jgi:hypothetical protein
MPVGVSFRALMGAGAADNSAWDVIDVVELGSAAASITFNDLSGYRLLRVTGYFLNDGTADNIRMRINGDTGGNYDNQRLTGSNTAVSAGRATGSTGVQLTLALSLAANNAATAEVVIAKNLAGVPAMAINSAVTIGSAGTAIETIQQAIRWNNTADLISSFIFEMNDASNFAAGTLVAVEGVPD